MKSGRERTKSSRAFASRLKAARLRTHVYIDNLSVTFSGFSCLHTIFTSPFLVNYINFPLNWENKNHYCVNCGSSQETKQLGCLPSANKK